MPKFAVITGASSGIGAEFARQLSARGYNLLLVARRADRLEKLSDQLTTVCEIFTADLSKKSECLRLVKALEGRRVDLFINNAGFGDCGPFLQTELDKDLDMLSVNIRALHILTKRIVQQMEEQGGGALLNVGSCAGLMPAGPYMAAYYATKAYVVSLTSALAQELREAVQDDTNIDEELGDLLFAAVRVASTLDKDPEQALHSACEKFIRRFTAMEQSILAEGRTLEEVSREELLASWDAQKRNGR